MNYMSQENPIQNPVQKKSNMKIIALAVVCVILAASLVGVIAIYQPSVNSNLQAQITEKDKIISDQNATLQSQLTQTNNNIAVYAQEIANLQQQVSDANSLTSGYYNIAIMNASSSLVYQQPLTQDANATTTIFSDAIDYSGYVVVQATATANTTYAEVLYSYAGAIL